jgi:hypothetical protein
MLIEEFKSGNATSWHYHHLSGFGRFRSLRYRTRHLQSLGWYILPVFVFSTMQLRLNSCRACVGLVCTRTTATWVVYSCSKQCFSSCNNSYLLYFILWFLLSVLPWLHLLNKILKENLTSTNWKLLIQAIYQLLQYQSLKNYKRFLLFCSNESLYSITKI